jgi:hypothetical protein
MTLKYENPERRFLLALLAIVAVILLVEIPVLPSLASTQVAQPCPWGTVALVSFAAAVTAAIGAAGYWCWPVGGRWAGFAAAGVVIAAAIGLDAPRGDGRSVKSFVRGAFLPKRFRGGISAAEPAFRVASSLKAVLAALLLIPLAMLPTMGLNEFANWRAAEASYSKSPIHSLCGLAFIEGVSLFLCFGVAAWKNQSPCPHARSRLLSWLACGVVVLLGTVLSFRDDMLFEGSSAFHWAYYIGPVQSLRHGAALLHDQPSQYGLLNVLLVSVFPHASVWQSFYAVQSLLLLGCVLLGLRTFGALGVPFRWWGLMFGCWFVILFFAHPAFIGPQPYPSSSVMRFGPCYLMLALAVKRVRFGFATFGPMIAWVLGLLWAAETAFYCSIAAAAFVVGRSAGQDRFGFVCREVRLWAAAGAAAITFFTLSYRVVVGCWPDWSMYTMYVIGYGAGFSDFTLSFPAVGAWMFLILLVTAMAAACRAIRAAEGGGENCGVAALATGLAWSVCSYYVGRPVQTNVLALAPLLVLCAAVVLVCASRTRNCTHVVPLQCALFPFLVMLITSTFGSHLFYTTIRNISSFTPHVAARLPSPADGLVDAMSGIRLAAGEAWVYYGDEALAPTVPGFEAASASPWLPVPLQMLQEPLTVTQRDRIIARRAGRYANGGVLIYSTKYAAMKAGRDWIRLLDSMYSRLDSYEGADYGAIRFGNR